MKVLNLDEISKVTRQVTIKGATYDICEMSVDGFVDYTKYAKELTDKGDKLTAEDNLSLMVKTISVAIPDAPKDVLAKLSILQLTTLVEFINGQLDADATAAAGAEGGEAKKS